MKHFDTDYMGGCHPLVMKCLLETNLGQTPGYGLDSYLEEAKERILSASSLDCLPAGEVWGAADIHFLIGGTQTNSTFIDVLLMRVSFYQLGNEAGGCGGAR